ncbi:uncharacterized protein TNCV_1686811 [Trichonephila clavipes]|nr:uncharacterized protein TNCV_1686811 [Trichonephila clavipes]
MFSERIKVVEAFISESPVLSIKWDKPVNITCHVKDPVGTVFLFWYHNGTVLEADEKEQRGIEVFTELGFFSISRLFIANAKLSDSGNYSCQPSYSKPANVTLQSYAILTHFSNCADEKYWLNQYSSAGLYWNAM